MFSICLRHKFSYFSKEAAAAHLSKFLRTLPLRTSRLEKILFPQSKPMYLLFFLLKIIESWKFKENACKKQKTCCLLCRIIFHSNRCQTNALSQKITSNWKLHFHLWSIDTSLQAFLSQLLEEKGKRLSQNSDSSSRLENTIIKNHFSLRSKKLSWAKHCIGAPLHNWRIPILCDWMNQKILFEQFGWRPVKNCD